MRKTLFSVLATLGLMAAVPANAANLSDEQQRDYPDFTYAAETAVAEARSIAPARRVTRIFFVFFLLSFFMTFILSVLSHIPVCPGWLFFFVDCIVHRPD